MGNFMSTSNLRGTALGFKFESLLKLREHKSNDGRSTLLHLLVNFLEDNHPDVSRFYDEISAVEDARKANFQHLVGEVAEVRTSLQTAEAELVDSVASDEVFANKLQMFVDKSRPLIVQAEMALATTEKSYGDMLGYYGEEYVPPDEFFNMIQRFNAMITSTLRELTRTREVEKKNIAKEQTNQQQDGVQTGRVMDSIITSLRNDGRDIIRQVAERRKTIILEEAINAPPNWRTTLRQTQQSRILGINSGANSHLNSKINSEGEGQKRQDDVDSIIELVNLKGGQ